MQEFHQRDFSTLIYIFMYIYICTHSNIHHKPYVITIICQIDCHDTFSVPFAHISVAYAWPGYQ